MGPVAVKSSKCMLVADESWTLDSFGERMIRVRRVYEDPTAILEEDDSMWVTPVPGVARGPVAKNQKEIYLKAVADLDPVEIKKGDVLGELGAVPADRVVELAAFDAAAEASASVVKDVFGRKPREDFADGWLSPAEFGPVLAMLEASPGGATLGESVPTCDVKAPGLCQVAE